jgi:hydroxymethylpyrimidine kinase/phosphomethylpyrimidine kinase
MVSTSGSQLLPKKAIRELRLHLLPMATVLTPNVPEALLLLSDAGNPVEEPRNIDGLIEMAKSVQTLGSRFVLLKGGHLPFKRDGSVAKTDLEREIMVDVLYGEGQVTQIESGYQISKNTHGTGCSLACKYFLIDWAVLLTSEAAIASNLASGTSMIQAVKRACRYIETGIRTSPNIGQGNGPINHFHSFYTLPFAPYVVVSLLLALLITSGVGLSSTCWIEPTSKLPGRGILSILSWRVLPTEASPLMHLNIT